MERPTPSSGCRSSTPRESRTHRSAFFRPTTFCGPVTPRWSTSVHCPLPLRSRGSGPASGRGGSKTRRPPVSGAWGAAEGLGGGPSGGRLGERFPALLTAVMPMRTEGSGRGAWAGLCLKLGSRRPNKLRPSELLVRSSAPTPPRWPATNRTSEPTGRARQPTGEVRFGCELPLRHVQRRSCRAGRRMGSHGSTTAPRNCVAHER